MGPPALRTGRHAGRKPTEPARAGGTSFRLGAVELVARDAYDYLRGYAGAPFAATVTDPPYGIGIVGMDGKRWDNGFPHPDFWAELLLHTEEGGWLACFTGVRTFHRSALALETGGWRVQDTLAWIRPYAIGRAGGLKRGWEAIILASRGNPRPLNTHDARVAGGGIPNWPSQSLPDNNRALTLKRGRPENRRETRSPSSVVVAAEDAGILGEHDRFFIVGRSPTRERGAYNTHPSVKPISLMEHLLVLLARPGGTFFDPFVGSGSTLVAALRLGVPCVGCEIDRDYCAIAAKRLRDAAAAAKSSGEAAMTSAGGRIVGEGRPVTAKRVGRARRGGGGAKKP